MIFGAVSCCVLALGRDVGRSSVPTYPIKRIY